MRDLIQTIYICFLRLMGLYGLLLVGWFVIVSPSVLAEVANLGVVLAVIIAAILFAALAMVIAYPRWTPRMIARPSGLWDLFPNLIAHGLFPMFYIIASIGISLAYESDPDAGKALALMVAIVPIIVFGLMWWMSLFLCVLSGGSYAPPKRQMPKPLAPLDPPASGPNIDARSLRKARMS